MNIDFELNDDQINDVLKEITHEQYLDSITFFHNFESLVNSIFEDLENYEGFITEHSDENVQKLNLVKNISLKKLKQLLNE